MNDLQAKFSQFVRQPWRVAVAVLLLTALWVASGALFPSSREVDRPAPTVRGGAAPEVVVSEISAEEVSRTVTLFGRTEPARSVELKAETTGRVVSVGVPRGSRVGAGAVILQLDDADRLARLTQARATLRQRELEFEGQTKLRPSGYISDAKLAESQAMLEMARAELRRAELDIARMTVRAPFAGALQDRFVEQGDYVSPGTKVANFVDERSLVVAASVAEKDIGALRRGLAGEARLATGERVRGILRYVAPVSEGKTRTFAVELEIPNAAGALRAGVTAEVDVPVGKVRAHRLPSSLLTLAEDGTVGVKIVDKTGRAHFMPTQVARADAGGTWVTGLPDPAPVITGGQGYVKSGQVVRAQRIAAR